MKVVLIIIPTNLVTSLLFYLVAILEAATRGVL